MKRMIRQIVVVVILVSFPASLIAAEDTETDLAASYEFSFPGGLSRLFDRYTYVPPDNLTVMRTFAFKESGPPRSCTYQVPECGETDVVDMCDLEARLLDDHVLALWPEDDETVFGGDARHYDGVVFTITSPTNGYLSVGVLCRDHTAECSAEHRALLNLRRTFTELSGQARSSAGCENLKN